MADNSGWARLGQALGGIDRQGIQDKRFLELAERDKKVAEARILGDEATQRLRLADALVKGGETPERALMLSSTLRAGFNPEQVTGAGLDMQERNFRQDAVNSARDGNYTDANANLFGVASGPQALPQISDGLLIENRFKPGSLATTLVTPTGEADIAARNAQARASDASAYASNTRGQLNEAKRTNPAAFYDTGDAPVMGADGVSTMRGPRGLVLVSTGDKTLDRENVRATNADLELLDLIESTREFANDERNFGAVGRVRGITQNLIQQGDALAAQFGNEAQRIRNEIAAEASDVDMGMFDPNLTLLELQTNVLAYKMARAMSGTGVLSNQDVSRARESIGDPMGMLGNQKAFLTSMRNIELGTANRLRNRTPQGQGNQAIPGVLAETLGLPAPAAETGGPLQADSIAQVVAAIEADAGRRLTDAERAQVAAQLSAGKPLDVAVPPPVANYPPPLNELGAGDERGTVPPPVRAPAAVEYDYVPGRGLVPRN